MKKKGNRPAASRLGEDIFKLLLEQATNDADRFAAVDVARALLVAQSVTS